MLWSKIGRRPVIYSTVAPKRLATLRFPAFFYGEKRTLINQLHAREKKKREASASS